MTGRIDHAALASQTIKNMREEEKSGGQSEVLAMAQVHATLALVEQQRTANLIAVMESAQNAEISGLHQPEVTQWLSDRITPVIKETLGLD